MKSPDWYPVEYAPMDDYDRIAIRAFSAEVNRRAEAAILAGGPMTGAHMRAMVEVMGEVEGDTFLFATATAHNDATPSLLRSTNGRNKNE